MTMQRLGFGCVAVSLVLHGTVAVVALARSGTNSPQQASIYEVLLANSPSLSGPAKLQRQISKNPGMAARPQAATTAYEKPTPELPVTVPTEPPAAAKPHSPVAAPLALGATGVREQFAASGSVPGVEPQTVGDEGAGSPLPQLGSSGAPSFSRQVAPVYPAQARRLGREGMVVLKLAIDAEGRLQGVEVVQAASFGFTEAALTAIRQSSYRPALKAGRPVQAQALITIRFTLRS